MCRAPDRQRRPAVRIERLIVTTIPETAHTRRRNATADKTPSTIENGMTMMTTIYAAAIGDASRLMRDRLDGAITTGIVPEREVPSATSASSPSDDEPTSGGNLLMRAWRLVSSPVARPKTAEGSLT